MQPEDVLIVGAGPAGISAAIQLQRSRVPFTLLEKDRVGGLLWNANLVENYPGFPNGITGPRLAGLFEKHMRRAGVPVNFDRVLQVSQIGDELLVTTEQTSYQPRYMIVATGTKPRPIPISIPEEFQDRILSVVHPLLDLRDQQIVVVGAGDAAFDYALNLAKYNKVSILHRQSQTHCLPLLLERAAVCEHIIIHDCTAVERVKAARSRGKLLVEVQHSTSFSEMECDYLVYAIGRVPQLDMLSPSLLAERSKFAHLPRVHLVGDVINGYLRQTAIAAGDGLRAAMRIYHEISRKESQIL
ncbi:MAG TPA: NAD(P)/FAD-dependent oxidoreductase [Anaerolineales bacterium]|nr:NAD(P)/FAD-dependent oxidoreductase [Anaerolineales bacterium]